MARARSSSGGGAATAWLIVFLGIGFVVSLVLAIVFYTQVEGLKAEAQEARSDLGVYVNRELALAPVVTSLADQQAEQGPVVQQLLSQNERLKALIGDPQLDTAALASRVREAVPDGTLLRRVDRLSQELADAREQRDEAARQVEQAQQQVAEARQRADERTATYDQQVTDLRDELEEVTAQFEAYQQRVAEMENDLREQIDAAQRSRQDRIAELEAQVDSFNVETEDLRRQLREANRRAEPLDTPDAVEADGEIVSVQEQANTAFINLGRSDGLVLGLTFEVYDPNELVRVGALTEATNRGKATVEVINVGDTSSRVRFVRQSRGTLLAEGDQLVNLVYDARTRYRFFVYGEFDLDNTGEPSASDRRSLENTISRWNGQLADELSYGVDYLVLGGQPPMPDPLPDGEIDPVRIREHVEATEAYEHYQALIVEARELNIPVLNQNRFLTLIGYYQR